MEEQKTKQEIEKEIEDYNNRVKKLTKHALKYVTRPFEYREKFLEILLEGEQKQFITTEYAEQKRSELIHKMNSPSRMKDWVRAKLQRVKNKIKPEQLQELRATENKKEEKEKQ